MTHEFVAGTELTRDDALGIFESAPNPYLLVAANPPIYTIAAVNEAYLKATGTERLNILGRPLFEVFPDNPSDATASGVSDLRASLDRVVRYGAADGMGVQQYDIPKRDGTDAFETRYWSPVNTPVLNSRGDVAHIIHHVEDVTAYMLARQQQEAEATRKAHLAGDVVRMEAEVLRSQLQIKQSNRDLKSALELLAEANDRLHLVDQERLVQLDLAHEAAQLGAWALDLASDAFTTSAVCRSAYGWTSSDDFTYAAMLDAIHPEDRALASDTLTRASDVGGAFEFEHRVIRPGRDPVWLLVRGRVNRDVTGEGGRALGVTLDITERKRAELRQNTMIAELNHRVKNTLASVQSIALQTSMLAQTPREFIGAFEGRLRALIRAHDLLTENSWISAELEDVVSRTLAPYVEAGGQRVKWSGPHVQMAPDIAVTLHMAFHELATNAAKYGALSTPNGSVAIDWRRREENARALFSISWKEQGGPTVEAPARRGFGTGFLMGGLKRELGAQVEMNFNRQGLACVIEIPASAKFDS